LLFGACSSAQTYFTPNEGQWSNPCIARNLQAFGSVFIESQGFKIKQVDPEAALQKHHLFHQQNGLRELTVRGNHLFFKWEGSNVPSNSLGEPANHYENYFVGADRAKWKSKIYPVSSILQSGIYEGIDLKYYGVKEGVEFDLIVHPGAEVHNIQLAMEGETAALIQNGEAVFSHGVGEFRLAKPFAYQLIGDEKLPVYCQYILRNNILSFEVSAYNRAYDLVIDPILVFSTYSGSTGDNFGFTATFDSKGNLYAGGIIDTTQGAYPFTAGAFQTIYGGVGSARAPVNLGCDISISKYSSDGSSLIYASYYGGKDDEFPHSLVCDPFDNLLIFGTTWSDSFPVTVGAYDTTYNGLVDIIVGKVNPDGTTLMASTYVGGSSYDGFNGNGLIYNYADDFRGDIITDEIGRVYIASTSRSGNFPTTSGAHSTSKGGNNDGLFLALEADLSKLNYATFIGGSEDDAAYSIKLQDTSVFIGGGTKSQDINWPTGSLHPNYLGGEADGFLCEFNKQSGKLIHGTYYGSDDYDQVYFIEVDLDKRIYATGQTEGTIGRTAGTYGKDNTKQFISCLKPSLDSLIFSTTFGNRTSTPELSPSAFMVDNCYNIYFSGWGSFTGTTTGLEFTNDANQKTTDGADFYLVVLSKDAKSLVYASYFGGNASEDHVDGGTSRFDKSGVVYQSVCASCPDNPPGLQDFPTSAWAVFKSNPSYRCSNASFKLDFEITYAVNANFTYSPIMICSNDSIRFKNLSKPGLKYHWNFGDGDTSLSYEPVHQYQQEGFYKVILTVLDPVSCNLSAIKELTVEVGKSPTGGWNVSGEPCTNEYEFELEDGTYASDFEWTVGTEKIIGDKKFKRDLDVGVYPIQLIIKHPSYKCYDTFTTVIDSDKDSSGQALVANVFTPNADGKNDCWSVKGLTQECDKMRLDVYNRWNERVFSTKDPKECWLGLLNNTSIEVPDGTYFFILEILESKVYPKNHKISGSITLIR